MNPLVTLHIYDVGPSVGVLNKASNAVQRVRARVQLAAKKARDRGAKRFAKSGELAISH